MFFYHTLYLSLTVLLFGSTFAIPVDQPHAGPSTVPANTQQVNVYGSGMFISFPAHPPLEVDAGKAYKKASLARQQGLKHDSLYWRIKGHEYRLADLKQKANAHNHMAKEFFKKSYLANITGHPEPIDPEATTHKDKCLAFRNQAKGLEEILLECRTRLRMSKIANENGTS